jgi:uncharacterized protein YqeY
MSIKETLQANLTEAIRSRDEIVSGTIRMVLTAITNEEVSGKEARVLTDAESLLYSRAKQRSAAKQPKHFLMQAARTKLLLKKRRVK